MARSPHPRRFRFGVQLNEPLPGLSWTDSLRRLEALGYDAVQIADHFSEQWGPIACLGAAAEATTDLTLGTLVFANDYRHPAVLAKEVATIDQLSGGRAELGIGAGWKTIDYDQTGITLDRPGVRIERMAEAVDIIRGLFGPDPVHHDGAHYSIDGLDGQPKPVRDSGIPIVIGGGGERMLRTAATHADIVGVTANLRSGELGADAAASSVAAEYDRRLDWIRDAAGDRFDELELNSLTFTVQITNDIATAAAGLASMFDTTPDDVIESPAVLLGSIDQIVDALERRRERWGFSYVCVNAPDVDTFAPVVEQLTGR